MSIYGVNSIQPAQPVVDYGASSQTLASITPDRVPMAQPQMQPNAPQSVGLMDRIGGMFSNAMEQFTPTEENRGALMAANIGSQLANRIGTQSGTNAILGAYGIKPVMPQGESIAGQLSRAGLINKMGDERRRVQDIAQERFNRDSDANRAFQDRVVRTLGLFSQGLK